jgi:hypothetical protein
MKHITKQGDPMQTKRSPGAPRVLIMLPITPISVPLTVSPFQIVPGTGYSVYILGRLCAVPLG